MKNYCLSFLLLCLITICNGQNSSQFLCKGIILNPDTISIRGISGIEYLPEKDSFLIVSDDPTYPVIYLCKLNFNSSDPSFTKGASIPFRINNSTHYNGGIIGLESIRYDKQSDEMIFAIESDSLDKNGNPVKTRGYIASKKRNSEPEIVGNFYKSFNNQSSFKYNSAFESICYSADKKNIYLAVEQPMVTGQLPDENYTWLFKLDRKFKLITAYAYPLEKKKVGSNVQDEIKYRISEICSDFSDPSKVYVLEIGYSRRLDSVFARVQVVSCISTNTDAFNKNINCSYSVLKPSLVFDLDQPKSVSFHLDNVEGMTLFESQGKRSFVFVTDDNLKPNKTKLDTVPRILSGGNYQDTQILLFQEKNQ